MRFERVQHDVDESVLVTGVLSLCDRVTVQAVDGVESLHNFLFLLVHVLDVLVEQLLSALVPFLSFVVRTDNVKCVLADDLHLGGGGG